ncbi:unnamed protein product [Pleuronectes platessa]|uniref:Uncharacterized protein n=1 Tax=Pleuronectes platessa TaxID=8262 RepID=A0A9N7YIY7_PLEPL|nr:unnamed protein product [Pleuronectes platessa]
MCTREESPALRLWLFTRGHSEAPELVFSIKVSGHIGSSSPHDPQRISGIRMDGWIAVWMGIVLSTCLCTTALWSMTVETQKSEPVDSCSVSDP